MQPLITVQNLCLEFITGGQKTEALKGISFDVGRGEIVAIVGESGSGKSVTALSILQLLSKKNSTYTDGRIIFTHPATNATVDILRADKQTIQNIRGQSISMVFQEPMASLNPLFTCGNQITECLVKHKKMSTGEAKKTAIDWLKKVQLQEPEVCFSKYPHQLSGGQKQRVMIAMAMCCEPALLICDEPTTALDVTVQKSILQLIKQLQSQTGMSVIFITHNLGIVAEIADRVVVMYKGSIVEENVTAEIFRLPKHPYTKGLLSCRPELHPKGKRLPLVADFIGENQFSPPDALTDANRHADIYSSNQQFTKPIITVENLSVEFLHKKGLFKKAGVSRPVKEVSFTVHENEILGLVGESGCGKTTLSRALLRLISPSRGRIIFHNRDLALLSANRLKPLRRHLQIVFQDPYSSLNPQSTIGKAIMEPLLVHGIFKTRGERTSKAISLLEKVGLNESFFNRYPFELSGGQRQRVAIARALALEPAFIICDESVSALDVSVQAQILNLLNDLKRELNFSIIFISHDLSVVHYFCDNVLVMKNGEIVDRGSATDIFYHSQNEYTRQLINSSPKVNPSNIFS